jgi:hypothetical protein
MRCAPPVAPPPLARSSITRYIVNLEVCCLFVSVVVVVVVVVI